MPVIRLTHAKEFPMPVLSCRNPLLPLLFVATIAGCGGEEKEAATQVAARVNREEISIHQINNVLARTGKVAPEQAKAAGQRILEELVDQELLVQRALEDKLDREPRVMQAIEATRRDLLARAYLDKVTRTTQSTAEEIRDFYGKHPELFSERRIYQFQELAIQPSQPDFLSGLRQRMSEAKSLEDVVGWLKAENIPFSVNTGTKAAEQLPLELLPQFHRMRDGQIGVIPAARDSVMVVQLVASRDMPMDEKAATPVIEQFLNNQRRKAAAEQEVKRLRETARIEYLGEFAAARSDGNTGAVPDAQPDVKPEPGAAEVKADKAYLDKGISGLK